MQEQREMKQTALPASQSFILRQFTLLDLLITIIKQKLGHVNSQVETEMVHRFLFLFFSPFFGGMLLEAWRILVS